MASKETNHTKAPLDFWLVGNSLQDDIDSVDIKTSIKSDHSAIRPSINGLDDLEKGPNFWKFNSNLVNDSVYCELLTTEYANWLEEFKDVQDKRVLWDLIKYKIRQQTIRYSKTKACKRRAKLQNLEKDLKECAGKMRFRSKYKKSGGTRVSLEYDTMYDCTLHKVRSFVLGQLGTNSAREITESL